MVSYALTNPQEGRTTGTMVYSVAMWLARRQEFLNASTCCIVYRIVLARAPNVPSKMGWEDQLEVGLMMCNIIRCLKKNGRRIWKLSRGKTIFYIAFPRNPSCAVKSRRSGQKLLRRLAPLPVIIGIPIRH